MVPTETAFRLEGVKPIVHMNDLWSHNHLRSWLNASHDLDTWNLEVYSALLLGWLALGDLLVSLLLLGLLRHLLVSLLLLALLRHLLALLRHLLVSLLLLVLLRHLLALLRHLLVPLLLLALLRHLLALLRHLLVSLLLALLLGWEVLISRRQWGLLLWGLLILSLLLRGLVILLGVWHWAASLSLFLSLRCIWMALLGWTSRKVDISSDLLIG
jgi:hypothetical protein